MRYIFIVFFIAALRPCVAQTNDSLATIPKLAVKWSPLSFLSRFRTIQLGVEYGLSSSKPRWTLSHEAGIVIRTANDTESYSNKGGFKATTELRYYVPHTGRLPTYFSAEIYYHQFKYNRTELIGYDCDTGDCSYYEYFSWRRKYTMRRASLRVGFMIYLDPREQLFLDFSAGLGYRIRQSKDSNKPALPPNGTSFGSESAWFESSMVEDEETFGPVGSFRFGFKFR